MCLYTLYIFVICLSVQSSVGNSVDDTDNQNLLTPYQNEPSDGTAITSIGNEVCDKAAALQSILGVMISLLREDLSENTKTAYILETLKEVLKNTAGYNNEVMYKINDLMTTLDKYRQFDDRDKIALRNGIDNIKPFKLIVKKPTQPNQKISLNYELPTLTNSYCTEALLNIIKIAYQTYVSLAKNPICNLPSLPELPLGLKLPDITSRHPDFLQPTTAQTMPEIWQNFFPKKKLPFLFSTSQAGQYPMNNNPDSENIPIEYKPIYEYHPPSDEHVDSESRPALASQVADNGAPNRPDPSNPFSYQVLPSHLTNEPYYPQKSNELLFDFPSHLPINPVYPYNPVLKPYPELNPQKNKPDVLFDVKPTSNQFNPYYPDANNPLTSSVKTEKPLNNIPLPAPYEKSSNPAMINSFYPYIPKHLIPELPVRPGSETPVLTLVDYSPEIPKSPAESHVFEFPYKTSEPNKVFPGSSLVPYPFNPSSPDLTNNDSPNAEIFGLNLNPNAPIKLYTTPSQSYAYMVKNPSQEFLFQPKELNPNSPVYPSIPINQSPGYPFEFYSNGAPIHPNDQNLSPYGWIPKTTSAVIPQDNPFFPNHILPPNTPQVQDLKVIEFIREAIDLIEKMIPVIKFDPPTLYIIAKIKDILVQEDKDIKANDYVTILELYEKLINYIEQLNVYKEIIDLINLSRVTNRPQLETKKVVELTYLVKRPQPVVYYPYYYIKYRLPYPSFVVAAQNLLKEKPQLRTDPNKLYEELLPHSKVAETSPDLKNYDKKDILGLTVKSGSLVDAKLVKENETFKKQLSVLRHIKSDLTAEEILELNKKDSNKTQSLATTPLNEQHSDKDGEFNHFRENKPMKTVESNEKQFKQQISPLIPDESLRTNFLSSNYLIDVINTTTEPRLDFTTFKSDKLRNDILRGRYVGLPFSDFVAPTNINPLHGPYEPDFKHQGPIAPAMYKLQEATFEANKLRTSNQQNDVLNSGGLVHYDNERIYLNAGNANHQAPINISHPKIMINSAASIQNLQSSDKTKTNLDVSSYKNSVRTANKQVNNKASISLQNLWSDQHNYYNSGGLVHLDNQKILLNTGTGNHQDGVNLINPKVMISEAADSVFKHVNPTAPDRYISTPNGSGTKTEDVYFEPTDAITDHDLVNFGMKGMGISRPHGNFDYKNIVEQTTRGSLEDISVTLPSPYAESPDKEENLNSVKDDVSQFENADDTENLQITGETYKPDFFNHYHKTSPTNGVFSRPPNYNLAIPDDNIILLTGDYNQHKNKVAMNGTPKDLDMDDSKIKTGSDSDAEHVVSNNNEWFPPFEVGKDLAYDFHAGTGQQGYEEARPQKVAQFFNSGIKGHHLISSQENFVHNGNYPAQHAMAQQSFEKFGIKPGFSGRQINYIVQRVPMYYKQPVIQRFAAMSSAMPFVSRFTRVGR